MTAIIMKKGVLHSVVYTVQEALKLNEDGYLIVAYVRYDGIVTQRQLTRPA